MHSPAPPAPAEPVDAGDRWWRRPVVWGLTIAFSGQAFAYYGLTAWLPVLLADRLGMTPAQAGVSASIFQIAAIAGAVGVPVLLRWCSGPRTAMAVVCGAWIVLPLGLLRRPGGLGAVVRVRRRGAGRRAHRDLRAGRPQGPRRR